MIVLGIDPGLNGGLAALRQLRGERARLLDAGDIPITGEGAKKRVDVAAVLAWVRALDDEPAHAVIERAQAMPDQGASSGFIYGRAVGALEACVVGLLIPLTVVEPTAWKKASNLMKSDKEASRQRALQLFPEGAALLARKMDHGRAEAALIARLGMMMFGRTP